MNWKGYLLAAVLWSIGLSLLGRLVFTRVQEIIETNNFEVQTATALVEASNKKMVVLDVRIQDKTLVIWFGNKDLVASQGMGMTERESEDVDRTFAEAAEWAIINRDVVVVSYRLARTGVSGRVYVTVRFECLARDIAEEANIPDCTPYQRWIEVKARNRRFG